MRKPFCLLALVLAATTAAQQPAKPPAQKPGTDVTIRETFPYVNVLFTASDRRDRFVTDLSKSDIQVFDNRKKQEIREFVRESDLPLRVGLLIDTSNSIRDRFKFEQEAAIEFLRSIIRPGADKVFLMCYDTNIELVTEYTDNLEELTKAIRALKAGGGTALYDAIYMGARDKFLNQPEDGSVRRIMVVIGDGDDNQSRASREETLTMVQRAEVVLFTIGTNISGQEQPGDKVLRRFATETGGRAFFPFRLQDMTTSFENISQELRSQYSLVYAPNTPRDGSFHTIEVVAQRKGVKVRARKGYFATP
jgi:VWFA-related protein